jgi:hypothetical protein
MNKEPKAKYIKKRSLYPLSGKQSKDFNKINKNLLYEPKLSKKYKQPKFYAG